MAGLGSGPGSGMPIPIAFAITFLRNGGNIYVLQEILGHSTLEMVRRYVKLAERDLASGHQLASPVANWNL